MRQTYILTAFLFFVAAFQELAAQPIVNNSSPTNIGAYSFQALGTINRNGSTVSNISLLYNQSPTLSGTVTVVAASPSSIAASSNGTVSISASLTSLSPNTTYYYRWRVVYDDGVAPTPDTLFTAIASQTSLSERPLVETSTVSNITSSSVTLQGRVNAQGISSTRARFVYWETSAPNTERTTIYVDIANDFEYHNVQRTIGSLAPNTEYSFRLEAVNQYQTTIGAIEGSEENFTTSILPPIVALNTINLSFVTDRGATLSGRVTSDGETQAYFILSEDHNFTSTMATIRVIETDPSNFDVTSTINNLEPATTYFYYFQAENTAGVTRTTTASFTTRNSPPLLTTGTATVLSSTRALLTGSIDPQGNTVNIYFEYILGSQTFTTFVRSVTGTTLLNVQDTAFNLQSNTTYNFRLVAEVDGTVTRSAPNGMFTTMQAPPAITFNAATNITSSSGVISAEVVTNGLITTASFEYANNIGFNNFLITTAQQSLASFFTAATLQNLLPRTTYFYRLRATSASGTTVSPILSFTTESLPPTITGLNVVANTDAYVVLQATINPNGEQTTASLEYWQNNDRNGTFSTSNLKSVGGGTAPVQFRDTLRGLVSSTIYTARVRAASIREVSSSEVEFVTNDKVPSVRFQAKSIGGLSYDTLQVLGIVNPNGLSTQWYFEYSFDPGFVNSFQGRINTINADLRTDALVEETLVGLSPRTTVFYRLVAINLRGASRTEIRQAVTLYGPPIVVLKPATNVSATSATLNVDINPGGLQTNLVFHLSQDPNFKSGTLFITDPINVGAGSLTRSNSATFSNLTPNRVYYFKAIAVRTDGVQYPSADVNQFKTLIAAPNVQLQLPVNVIRYDTASLRAILASNEAKTTYYFTYSKTSDFTNPINTVSDTSRKHNNVDDNVLDTITTKIYPLEGSTTYYFKLTATNIAGTRVSSTGSFSTGIAPPSVVLNDATGILPTAVTFSGTVNPNFNATQAWFEYWEESAPNQKKVTAQQSMGSSKGDVPITASVTGLVGNKTYYYCLVANQTKSIIKSFHTPVNPPTVNLIAPPVLLRYDTARVKARIVSNGFKTTYRFEYSTLNNFSSDVVSLPSDTTRKHLSKTADVEDTVTVKLFPLLGSTNYYYRVVATNEGGTTISVIGAFTTTISPPIITLNEATNIQSSNATLSGTINPNYNDPTNGWFEYWEETNPTNVMSTTHRYIGNNRSVTSFSQDIIGLTPGRVYRYRLVANQVWSETKRFTTLGQKALITSFAVGGVSNDTASISATIAIADITQSVAVRLVYVYQSSAVAGAKNIVARAIMGVSEYQLNDVIRGLESGSSYKIWVEAENAWGISKSEEIVVQTQKAAVVAVSGAINITTTSAKVLASVDPLGKTTKVNLEYSRYENFSVSKIIQNIASVPSTSSQTDVSYTLENLLPSQTYYVRIITQNVKGTVVSQDKAMFKTLVPEIKPTLTVSSSALRYAKKSKPSDYNASDWRLVGLPGVKATAISKALNLDPFKQGIEWDIYTYSNSSESSLKKYDEADDDFSLSSPAKGFWVISMADVPITYTANTPTMNANKEVEVKLAKGWNIITNPFNLPILWSLILEANGITSKSPLYAYTSQGYVDSDTLKPMNGYFYYANDITTLKISYGATFQTSPGSQDGLAVVVPAPSLAIWKVNASLKSGGEEDHLLTFGVGSKEYLGLKPASPKGAVTLSLTSSQSNTNAPLGYYIQDIAAASSSNSNVYEWSLTAQSKSGVSTDIVFSKKDMQRGDVIGVYDLVKNEYRVLGEDSVYTYKSVSGSSKFSIFVGRQEYISQMLSEKKETFFASRGFSIEQNRPNPFSNQTIIDYSLEKPDMVTLKVYDILSREVAVLVNEVKEAGVHSVVFDAGSLPSGKYFYRLTAGGKVFVKSMSIIK